MQALTNGLPMSLLWSIQPDSVPYMTSSSSTERGVAYDPQSGHVLLVSRAPGVGGLEIEVLDKLTGARIGTLNTSGISGGFFPLSQIDVASDGSIYAANLTLNSTTTPYTIYRWANESAAPVVAYSGDPSNGAGTRWGDSFRIRGSGPGTQIISASGLGTTTASLFQTSDGNSFNPTLLNVTGINPGEISLSLAFGTGNTFYGVRNGGATGRLVSFDPATGQAQTIGSLRLRNPNWPNASVSAIGVSLSRGIMLGAATAFNSGVVQYAAAYDLGSVLNGPLNPTDLIPFQTTNPDDVGVSGAVAWDDADGIAFILDTNNGLMAVTVPEPQPLALMALFGAAAIALRQRRQP